MKRRARLRALGLVLLPGLLAAQSLTRGTFDPRQALPGQVLSKVPDSGRFEPLSCLVFERRGAATELYLEEISSGKLSRIEIPRSSGAGNLRSLFSVLIEPGRYRWKGFSRWSPRSAFPEIALALDLPSVEFEVLPGKINLAGKIQTEFQLAARRPRRRQGRWRWLARESFRADWKIEPLEPGPELRARLAWMRRSPLEFASGLRTSTGSAQSILKKLSPGPSSWGQRPRD